MMIKLNQEHTTELRVYTEDTDALGIVYHANYLCFCDRARTEMLRDNGLSLTMMAKHDTYFAIHKVNLNFYFPARLDDVLMVKTSIKSKTACSLSVTQSVYNQSGVLLCGVTTELVSVSSAMKPKRLPVGFFCD